MGGTREKSLRRISKEHPGLIGLVRVQGRRVSSNVHPERDAEPGDLLCGMDAVATLPLYIHETRRLSRGHEHAIAATWHREGAIAATTSS